MRGSPVIQSVIITVVLGFLGFAGMRFIHMEAGSMPTNTLSENLRLESDQIPVEIECHFSDKPVSYTFLRPQGNTESERLISKSRGSEETPVFHDIVLHSEADNVIWVDIKWEAEKPQGTYFVELILSVGNQEPITRTFRSSSADIQGTIELDLTNYRDNE